MDNLRAQNSFKDTFVIRLTMPAFSLRCLWPVATVALLSCAGCNDLLNPPQPEPVPTTVPQPKPDFFDPAAGVSSTGMVPLNGAGSAPAAEGAPPSTAKRPDKFRVTRVETGELLYIQSVTKVAAGGATRDILGSPDIVRLAGIITPPPGQPGFAETANAINKWVLGQDVDVEQDGRFPVEIDSRRRIVQISFTARKGQWPEEIVDKPLLLNRMLVREGYAVVDLNSATIVDVKPWLNDEQFARRKRKGLWGLGIVLGQRIPPPLPVGSNVTVQRSGSGASPATSTAPRRRPGSTVTVETNKTTSAASNSATTTPGAAPPASSPAAPGSPPAMPGSPPAGMPSSPPAGMPSSPAAAGNTAAPR